MEVMLRKGKQLVRLTDPIQVAAFMNNGWVEVKAMQKNKHEDKG